MKFSFRKLLLVLLGLGLVGLVIYAFLPQPIPVDLAEVSQGDLQVTVDEDGKTRIKKHARYVISAPLEGFLQRITLEPGDPVQAGDQVAVLEPRVSSLLDPRARTQAEARVKAAEALIKKAEAKLAQDRNSLKLAKTLFERANQLRPSGGISQEAYETALNQEIVAREEVNAAEFATKVANYELQVAQAALLRTQPRSPGSTPSERFEIWSPIGGEILKIYEDYDKNATVVNPGARLIEVGNMKDLEIEVDVLSQDAVKIRPGAKVILEQWGGDEPLLGKVRKVEPSAFLKISALGVEEQRVWVIIDLVSPLEKRKTLGDAYRVEARIVTWEGNNIIKAPSGALFREKDGWAAFVVRDGKAILQPLRIGHGNGMHTEILEGLQENDRVILHPSDKIKNGVEVAPR